MEELSDATGVMEVDCAYSYGLDLIAQDRFDIGSSAWDATFYLYDGHGNVRALADDAGTITDTYDYDAFGTLIEQLVLDISASGLVPVTTDNRDLTTDNQYLYCGEQFDPDLGLYFLRARYMDTDRGRFWSMDSFEGWRNEPLSLHKYLYCESNPVMFVDPTGTMTLVEVMKTSAMRAFLSGFSWNLTINIITGERHPTKLIFSGVIAGASTVVGGQITALLDHLGPAALSILLKTTLSGGISAALNLVEQAYVEGRVDVGRIKIAFVTSAAVSLVGGWYSEANPAVDHATQQLFEKLVGAFAQIMGWTAGEMWDVWQYKLRPTLLRI